MIVQQPNINDAKKKKEPHQSKQYDDNIERYHERNNKKNRRNRNKNKATASATASRDNNNGNNDNNNNNKNNRMVGCENTGPSLSDNLAIKDLFGQLHSALDDKDTKALDKLLTDKRGDVYGTTLEKIEELSKLASEKDFIIECMTRNPGSTNCDCYVTIMQTLLENFIDDRRTTKGEMDGAIVSSYSLYVAATFESFVEDFTDTKIIDIMHEVRYRYL
jgi:hypothetical protein